jgi:hypothetical protein
LWFQAFVGHGVFYHVKVSEYTNLDDEVRRYNDAWARFGKFMPRPLGYVHREGRYFFVMEGVVHQALLSRGRRSAGSAPRLPHEVVSYFEAAGGHRAAVTEGRTHSKLLERLEARFRSSPHAPLLVAWLEGRGTRELDALGVSPQHGDFVLSNLGIAAHRLVIFDWEDFGKICLPGFDLCTLVISSIDLETDDLDCLVEGRGPLVDRLSVVVMPACKALGIEAAQFWHAFPLYLLTFLYLKDAYATDVRRRIESCLNRLYSDSR